MTKIIIKIRDLVEDNYQRIEDNFEYVTSKIFGLTEENVDVTSIVVERNGVVYASSNYSYNATTGKLTVTGTLTVTDILQVIYNAYEKYSTKEMQSYIRAAITYLSTEQYRTFAIKEDNIIFPTPNETEENLIALIASIIIKGSIRSYRTPDFTLNFNENESKEDKIKKVIRQFTKTYGVITYIDLGESQAYEPASEE